MAKLKKGKKQKVKSKSNSSSSKNVFIIALVLFVLVVLVVAFYGFQTEEGDKMNPVVVLETSKGNIKLELDRENATLTTENFIKYVEDGHYDGLIFHRVMSNFMIQGGGFTPDGNQRQTRDPIKLESDNGLKNVRGSVAMARTVVEDSATSQFFINLNDNDFLNRGVRDAGYAVFGKVIEGMDVVDAIARVQTANRAGHGDWPVEDVLIIRAYLE